MNEDIDDISDDELKNLISLLDELPENDESVDYDLVMNTLGINLDDPNFDVENYCPSVELKVFRSLPNSVLPKYEYNLDSGFDLHSTEDLWIHSLDRKLIPTGIHLDIPEGYEIQIRSKSGLALNQGLMVLNSPGTVDQGYTGEIKIILFNTTKEKIKILKGQKIAQAVLCPVVFGKWVKIVEKNKLEEKDRNSNGFGSTGI